MTKHSSHACRDKERGYVLLVLLLSLALLSIGSTVLIQGIEFEIKRDREEELIHRGVQYSRAVRKFIKAFGRYPNSIEELEKTNNMRFLRRRYKDPITGKDFKILHLTDLPSSKPVLGAISVTRMVSQQSTSSRALDDSAGAPRTPVASGGSDLQTTSDDESSAASASREQSSGSDTSSHPQQSPSQLAPVPTHKFGGGPMVGVASLSKRTTIREFDRKNHYNEWQFVYDPSTDRGVLLTTPNQPALRAARLQNGQDHSSFRALGANSANRNPADGAQFEPSTSE
jgi:type II secretory pathway pseudopilin PulG